MEYSFHKLNEISVKVYDKDLTYGITIFQLMRELSFCGVFFGG
jgi:hypothetical protein